MSSLTLASNCLAGQPVLDFTDLTDQAGLTSINDFSPDQNYARMIAGGVAADFNNDGYDDILHLGSLNPNSLFINNKDGTFTDQAADWGIAGPFHSYAASAADFNNDGYIDIFITAFGPAAGAPQANVHMLMRNNGPDNKGQWSFTDIAQTAGVNQLFPGNVSKEGTGSGWGDYDLDGDLDLFVCAYSALLPGNRLFRNDGLDQNNNWKFTDVTAEAGLEQTGIAGFLPSLVDMNNDRYPDLIIIGDAGSSKFYTNNQDGTFTDTTNQAQGLGTANGMGIDTADINNDGLLDFFVSNIRFVNPNAGGNILLIQNPDNSFTNTATSSGARDGYWGWGSLINDFDHDGDKDILETNGWHLTGFGNKPVTLYLNNGDATQFTESAQACGIAHTGQGRGLIRLDADNDGDIDAVIFNYKEPTAFYSNNLITPKKTPPNAHWSRIKLDTSARDSLAPQGIGAMITVSTATKDYLLPIHNNVSYCGTSPAEAHIGLASESTISAIRVAWPDGSFTTWTDQAADQILTLSAPAFAADYDASGTVDIDDIYTFIGAMGSRSLTADHNGDAQIDFFDISAFLTDYRQATTP
ncbi:MAG: CRTAC1 family protein [Phycisphaerales bacterium]|nr:CRTAC1 family protein [Phycisphaerales bacterium]